MKDILNLITVFFLVFYMGSSSAKHIDVQKIAEAFVVDFAALSVQPLTYSYVENFENVPHLSELFVRQEKFDFYAEIVQQIDPDRLTEEERYVYEHLKYEVDFNQERVRLEIQYKTDYPDLEIPNDGLYRLPNHENWYRLYARYWSSSTITLTDIWALGNSEIKKISHKIKGIQNQLGFRGDDEGFYMHLADPRFLIRDQDDVLRRYVEKRSLVSRRYSDFFEDTDIPMVEIAPIPSPNPDTPPGYYTGNTFYFNFFGGSHNWRVMDWLFIHEAIPGHHYQMSLEKQLPESVFRNIFKYPGFSEGWGAYSEHLGREIGLYQNPYSELGKWEWDIVRSTRVVMDMGINLLGWSDQEALRFWMRHIPNQDAIAEREIRRMRRWPVQVISYKIGEQVILKLRDEMEKRLGADFDIKKFHSAILNRGSVPLDIIETNLSFW